MRALLIVLPTKVNSSIWFLLFWSICSSCSAACSISNPAIASLENMSLSSSNSLRTSTGISKFQYSFFISCSNPTNYQLTLDGLQGTSTGNLIINNPQGDQITVTASLKSIAGNVINLPFNNLPGHYYSGSIAAGQHQQVIVELTPVNITSKNKRASGGRYNGNGVINLIY